MSGGAAGKSAARPPIRSVRPPAAGACSGSPSANSASLCATRSMTAPRRSAGPLRRRVAPPASSVFAGRPFQAGSSTFAPSVVHGRRTRSSAASVGRRSMVSTLASTVTPWRCPGRLMNSGTAAMSANEASVACRKGKPGRRLAPWSAVTASSASSYSPAARRRATSAPYRRTAPAAGGADSGWLPPTRRPASARCAGRRRSAAA